MRWLLDSNVLSESVQVRQDPRVRAWIAQRAPDQFAISLVTLAELYEGVARAPTQKQRDFLQHWLATEIEPVFQSRTLPLTLDIVLAWLTMSRRLGARGRPQSAPDLLIAATARVHDLIVVTRNIDDFIGTGLTVFDPWSGKTHQMDEA